MIDFYPDFTHLCDETLRSGDQIEAAALERAKLIVYSSEWAARTAHQVYGVPESKLHVVPFGANLDQTPTLEEVRCMIAARSRRVCKLVFLGVDWYRKGGDVALAVARQLNAQGVPTTLVLAGSRPPRLPRFANGSTWPTWLQDAGTIGKRSPSRLAALSALLGDAHFLILPTRADCTPVTFSEANAFGVPVLSSQVGGIPSIIREGINGATFGAGDIAGYCDQIATWFSQPERYREVALAAYNEYATRLNWSTAAGEVTRLLEGIA
jgi:glycosyltransferase involved in cell wall biosynthesis